MTTSIIVVVVILVLILFFSAVRVVREYQRIVLFRLGRLVGQRGPGLILIIPFGFDRTQMVEIGRAHV